MLIACTVERRLRGRARAVVGDLRDGAPARFHVVSRWNLRVSQCPFAAFAAGALAAAADYSPDSDYTPAAARAADAAAHATGLRPGRGVWCCCRGPATSRCPSARTTSTRAQYVRLAERSRCEAAQLRPVSAFLACLWPRSRASSTSHGNDPRASQTALVIPGKKMPALRCRAIDAPPRIQARKSLQNEGHGPSPRNSSASTPSSASAGSNTRRSRRGSPNDRDNCKRSPHAARTNPTTSSA